MDFKNKKLVYWISIPSIIIISALIILSVSDALIPEGNEMGHRIPWRTNRCRNRIPLHIFWIGIAISMVAVGPLSYYLSSKKIDSKIENNMSTIIKLLNSNMEQNKEIDRKIKHKSDNSDPLKTDSKAIVMKILNPNERKLLQKLTEKDGSIFQSELSKNGSMTKLNVHRAVKSLEQKGVVIIENHGMTNQIVISKEMKELLF